MKKAGANKFTEQTKSPFVQGNHATTTKTGKMNTETVKKTPKKTGQK
jgi:hypothetical protein